MVHHKKVAYWILLEAGGIFSAKTCSLCRPNMHLINLHLTQCHRFSWKLYAQIFSSPIRQCFPPSLVFSNNNSFIFYDFDEYIWVRSVCISVAGDVAGESRIWGKGYVVLHTWSLRGFWPAVDCKGLCVLSTFKMAEVSRLPCDCKFSKFINWSVEYFVF